MFQAMVAIARATASAFMAAVRSCMSASSGTQNNTGAAVETNSGGCAQQTHDLRLINPHLVMAPFREGSADDFGDALTMFDAGDFQRCVARFRESYARANRMLMANPEVSKAFPHGVPLAYTLYPKLEPMAQDDLSAQKFGGCPDLRQMHFLNQVMVGDKVEQNPSFELRLRTLAMQWPLCACCRRAMTFICQMDLTDWALAIHALTSTGSSLDADDCRSGLGASRDLGSSVHRGWWLVFACRHSWDHQYESSDSDVRVWLDHRLVPTNDEDSVSDRSRAFDEETAYKLVEAFCRTTSTASMSVDGKEYLTDAHEHDLVAESCERCGFAVEPQRIVSLELGWQFDFGVDAEWHVKELIATLIEDNPDVFGTRSPYTIFGAPVAYERRYWALRGETRGGAPQRMLLCSASLTPKRAWSTSFMSTQ